MRFRFGGFELDDQRFALSGPAGPVHVEPQVFEVLRHLLVHRDRVVPKEELLDAIWGDRFVSESALTSRIKAARQAVGDDGQAQRVIRTVHGRGYQLVADVRTDVAGGRSLPRLRNAPLGRDGDIASLAGRVREGLMTTVTGPGGIGKTTVAIAVADRLLAEQPDGVVFVDLVPVPAGGDITRAVAEAAGVEGTPSESADRLAAHLADRPLLLVLDNCEHVLAPAAELVDRMLAAGGRAQLLATSREPLGVAGEHLWPLGPLADAGPALFVERARAAEPRVAWDAADPAVVQLCERLDGVPLALELAAGQLRRFDLDELNRRLGDRLAPLSDRAAAAGRRHTTMETAIDWSYRLLDDDEQRLLRHLAVHPSSFSLDAVEGAAPALGRGDAVEVLGRLVDKSLVVRQPGSGRYRLLETIRMFARDRLEEAGESQAAFERHRCDVRDRAASRSRLDRWLSARLAARFRADLDDARQAFWLSLAADDVPGALEIAVGASFLWRNAIGCAEGHRWIEELQGRPASPTDELWVHLLRADVGQGRGDHHQLFAAASSARRLSDGASDPGAACVASHFGALAHLTDARQAAAALDAALGLARRSGDVRLVTLIEAFGAVADLAAGHDDAVRSTVERLDGVASDDGYDRFILHWAAWMLGLAEHDAVGARRWMNQQQAYLDRTGIVETWITSFSSAICDVLDGGDVRTTLGRTLALADREGHDADADCLLALAYAELCSGRLDEAGELLGTAIRGRFNATANYVLYRAVLDRELRARLAPDRLDAAIARGRSRSPAEALAAHGVERPADLVVPPRAAG